MGPKIRATASKFAGRCPLRGAERRHNYRPGRESGFDDVDHPIYELRSCDIIYAVRAAGSR